MVSFTELKQRHRAVRDAQPEALSLRIHRALSWLGRAQNENQDQDACFLFLWIAFNAAYAREFGFEERERDQASAFVRTLLSCDRDMRLHGALHQHYTGPIRTLIENRFVFGPFWKALREHDGSGQWEESFAASKKVALRALMMQDTATVLSVVLDRLYVLRNQLVHGGSTWNGSANRAQVTDGVRIMSALVPVILDLMIASVDVDFGEVAFPLLPA